MSHWLTKEDENKSGETPDLLLEGNYPPVGQASRLSRGYLQVKKKILVGIDGLFGTENAAHYGLVIAEAQKADLVLVSIVNRDVDRDRLIASIKRIEDRAQRREIKTETILGEGNVVDEITKIVKKKDIDLLITSSGKRSEARGFFRWSIPWRLMLRRPCQMLIIKAVKLRPFATHKKILVPIMKPKEVSAELVDLLLSLAGFYAAQIWFLYCPPMAPAKIAIPKHRLKLDESASESLSPLCDRLRKKNIEADYYIRYSHDPIRSILNEAAVRHFSLTIIDVPKLGLLDMIAGGNPLEEALRLTTCNMMIWQAGKKRRS